MQFGCLALVGRVFLELFACFGPLGRGELEVVPVDVYLEARLEGRLLDFGGVGRMGRGMA